MTPEGPGAEAWPSQAVLPITLRELGDLGPGWREGDGLSSVVSSVRGLLTRGLGPRTDREERSVPHLVTRGRSGRWLMLHGAWTEPGSDRGSETMIVIEAAGPREVAWLKTSAYGLTKREREVVDLVARGASTRQISRASYISEYTVQDHLSSVFEKVVSGDDEP
ncbi:MAG: helix-turn-helix transcriptional regulator [Actinomycetota bacterium]|nr:helix-turn-helix transcriptional regulator [Actinomycetota bacterium]